MYKIDWVQVVNKHQDTKYTTEKQAIRHIKDLYKLGYSGSEMAHLHLGGEVHPTTIIKLLKGITRSRGGRNNYKPIGFNDLKDMKIKQVCRKYDVSYSTVVKRRKLLGITGAGLAQKGDI